MCVCVSLYDRVRVSPCLFECSWAYVSWFLSNFSNVIWGLFKTHTIFCLLNIWISWLKITFNIKFLHFITNIQLFVFCYFFKLFFFKYILSQRYISYINSLKNCSLNITHIWIMIIISATNASLPKSKL